MKEVFGLTTLINVGKICGILSVKYNPNKIGSRDGPFETSRHWLMYCYFVWILCWCVSLIVYYRVLHLFPHILIGLNGVIISLNMYFIICLIVTKDSFTKILNKLFSVVKKNEKFSIKIVDVFIPYLPLIVYPIKILFEFDWIITAPFLHLLVACNVLYTTSFNGLIFTWLLCGEKLYLDLNTQLQQKRRNISIHNLKELMSQSLDLEDYIHEVSRLFGGVYLFMSIEVIVTDVLYSQNIFSSIMKYLLNSSMDIGQSLSDVIHLIEWHNQLFFTICIYYKSHKLNIQVQRLKRSFQEIQAKGCLSKNLSDMVFYFEKKMDTNNVYFSAFSSINFNFHLIVTVMNKMATYFFAVSQVNSPTV